MVFIDNADGTYEHLTQKEFAAKYPELYTIINTHPDYITEGKRLRAVRAKYGKSLREVAERLGMTVSELNDIEKGRAPATSKIVDVYGMLGMK